MSLRTFTPTLVAVSRPSLALGLGSERFRDYYWLKEELVAFCREQGLPTGGAKTELVERITEFLHSGTILRPHPVRRNRAAPLPDTLSLDTVIGSGWRSGQQLRKFFEQQVGPTFRFNQAIIGFIRDGEGQTLREALAAWRASNESGPKPLAEQFEYNRHTREYGAQRPGATQQEIQAAWRRKRRRPRSEWAG